MFGQWLTDYLESIFNDWLALLRLGNGLDNLFLCSIGYETSLVINFAHKVIETVTLHCVM